MTIIAGVILISVVVINILLIFFWYRRFNSYNKNFQGTPKISILIAARNEQRNIRECLEALISQNYPPASMEIMVGDDMSSDDTAGIVREFSGVKLVFIKENIGKARGKANVLAHLAREATGDYFLITDADVRPNKRWVQTMVQYIEPEIGIINGVTGIENNLFQHYEWLYSQGMIKVLTDISGPVTAIGNNMLVTRKAYEAVGGYENLEFSVTEDLALFREIQKHGFFLRQVIEPGTYADSRSPGNIKVLLQQRKRWMSGAFQLPWWVLLILGLQALYFPFLVLGFIFNPHVTLTIFIIKLFLQSIFIKAITDKIDLKLKGGLILYEFYSGIISVLMMVNYLVSRKIVWKGRKY